MRPPARVQDARAKGPAAARASSVATEDGLAAAPSPVAVAPRSSGRPVIVARAVARARGAAPPVASGAGRRSSSHLGARGTKVGAARQWSGADAEPHRPAASDDAGRRRRRGRRVAPSRTSCSCVGRGTPTRPRLYGAETGHCVCHSASATRTSCRLAARHVFGPPARDGGGCGVCSRSTTAGSSNGASSGAGAAKRSGSRSDPLADREWWCGPRRVDLADCSGAPDSGARVSSPSPLHKIRHGCHVHMHNVSWSSRVVAVRRRRRSR